MEALPKEEIDTMKLHRDYISTMIYTLVGSKFTDWVNSKINERNEKIEKDKDMIVHMDPEIAEILQKSNSVSGKSFFSFCRNILVF